MSDHADRTAVRHRTLGLSILVGLAVTILLTFPRWLDTTNYRLIQLATATPLGTPAALVTGLLAMRSARRAPVGHRRLGQVAAVGAGCAFVLHLALLAPLYLGASPPLVDGPGIVVLAQNLETGRVQSLAEEAAQERADVIVLSDLAPPQALVLRASSLKRTYPNIVGIDGFGVGGVAVLSRLPIVHSERVTEEFDAWLVRIRNKSGAEIDVLAAHPAPPYAGQKWRNAYSTLVAFLDRRSLQGTQPALLIAGDLNATRDNRPLRLLLATGLRDAVEQANGGFLPTWPAPGTRRLGPVYLPPLVTIDHLLLDQRLFATRARTVRIDGADHLGVVAQITWSRPTSRR